MFIINISIFYTKFKEVFPIYLIKCFFFPCYFSDKKLLYSSLICYSHNTLIDPIHSTMKIYHKCDNSLLLNFFLVHCNRLSMFILVSNNQFCWSSPNVINLLLKNPRVYCNHSLTVYCLILTVSSTAILIL